ncbi:prephenate dehydratase [Flavobacteriaceae bacterium]|nr:prephenate dehydratase [Flavobacteriaceae bacterium]MDC1492805.1 prephenate dehydratase [Flavobacteriaceae bacterium]MDC1534744.1 prephenate dehydratase [Flavobacteriaceae bacterium]
MTNLIAIQGIKGSFHHIVTKQYFKNEGVISEFLSFDDLVESLVEEKCNFAVMALENSIAGSIIPNYALIDKNNLHIVGEEYLDIQHNLICLSGQSINDIHEVHSHPMALLQCKEFFKKHPNIKLVEDKDTAQVAKRISENKLKNIAAVASDLAAEIYSLSIINKSIQTIKHNETRFVILQNSINKNISNINKASVKFELDDSRGGLAAILNVLSDCKLNLTKIQSLPKIDSPWVYSFFIDITFDKFDDYLNAKSIISIMAKDFKVLGEYENRKK